MVRNDGGSSFQLLDGIRPKINGKEKYYRLIIRNLKPDLPEVVNISEMLEQAGAEAMIIPVKTMQTLP